MKNKTRKVNKKFGKKKNTKNKIKKNKEKTIFIQSK